MDAQINKRPKTFLFCKILKMAKICYQICKFFLLLFYTVHRDAHSIEYHIKSWGKNGHEAPYNSNIYVYTLYPVNVKTADPIFV